MALARRCVHCPGLKPDGSRFLFDEELSLVRRVSPQRFVTQLSNRWSVTTIPNGGFLSAIAVHASRQVIRHGNIISLSSHFYNRTVQNCATQIDVEILSSTNSSSTVLTTISQTKVKRCSFLLTFSFKKSNPFTYVRDSAPLLPPLEECYNASQVLRNYAGDKLQLAERVEFWMSKTKDSSFMRDLCHGPELTSTFASPSVSGSQDATNLETRTAEINCWFRFSDNRPITLTSLAFLNDCLPPPVLSLLGFQKNRVPTVEYAVQFWGNPMPSSHSSSDDDTDTDLSLERSESESLLVGQKKSPWVRGRFVTDHVQNGMLTTDSQIWSEDGTTLLANSRQLAKRVPVIVF